MPTTELVIAPGSADVTVFSVLDSNKQPVEFTVGSWTASVVITRFPGDLEEPLFEWVPRLEDGKILLDHDPTIVYEFTRAHFDVYIKGPNINSAPVRIDHGPVRIDF